MLKPTMPASNDVTAIGTLYSTGTKSGITAAAVPNAPSPPLPPTRTAWTHLLSYVDALNKGGYRQKSHSRQLDNRG